MLKQIFTYSIIAVGFLLLLVLYGAVLNSTEKSLLENLTEKGLDVDGDFIIVINKSNNFLEVFSDSILIKRYHASIGTFVEKNTTKRLIGTPSGIYKICRIDTTSQFQKSFFINYPNLEDSEKAFKMGILTEKEFEQLKFDFYYSKCINDQTRLGGNISIHGTGAHDFFISNLPFVFNWTDRSVGLSNSAIAELNLVMREGTIVEFK
ncbi:MAG: L,D-transpeptidase [Ignavibacteriaceae bacterium]|nr:L,D-transpeptidase [Ignavibacteriaceae bacterium]